LLHEGGETVNPFQLFSLYAIPIALIFLSIKFTQLIKKQYYDWRFLPSFLLLLLSISIFGTSFLLKFKDLAYCISVSLSIFLSFLVVFTASFFLKGDR